MTEYDDLRALFLNCTLKRSPAVSNTEGLIDVSRKILEKQGDQRQTNRESHERSHAVKAVESRHVVQKAFRDGSA